MAKLHQLLAVESDLDGKFKRVCEETKKTFAKPALFTGFNRRLEVFEEDSVDWPEENQDMTTTVKDRIDYTSTSIVAYLDALYQKEATNQTAQADLIVDGTTIGTKVPATFLLGLETRLKYIRGVYEAMPTLGAGIEWKPSLDKGDGIFEMVHPEEKIKTKMTFKSQILVEPTEHHPAQIEKWEEQIPVGKFIKTVWTGLVTSATKAEMLGRIDKLLRAVKMARQKANSAKVVNDHIAANIMDYINK